jgi:serine/threonine protein kinase
MVARARYGLVNLAKLNDIPSDGMSTSELEAELERRGLMTRLPVVSPRKLIADILLLDMPGVSSISTCDLNTLEFIKGVPSTTASDTDLYIVKLKGTDIELFMKIFSVSTETVMAERRYYTVVTGMYARGQIRNVLPCIGSTDNCNLDILADFVGGPDAKRRVSRNLHMMRTRNERPSVDEPLGRLQHVGGYPNPVGFIMTIRASNNSPNMRIVPGINLKATISDFKSYVYYVYVMCGRIDDGDDYYFMVQEFFQYVFQLFFTVTALSECGFNHNDLHSGNILMDSYYPSESQLGKYTWTYDNKKRVMYTNTRLIPRIFDFDLASMTNIPNQSYYKRYKTCSGFVARKDFLRIMNSIYGTLRDAYIRNTLFGMVKPVDSTEPDSTFGNTELSLSCDDERLAQLIDDPRKILVNLSAYTADLTRDMKKELKEYAFTGGRLVD